MCETSPTLEERAISIFELETESIYVGSFYHTRIVPNRGERQCPARAYFCRPAPDRWRQSYFECGESSVHLSKSIPADHVPHRQSEELWYPIDKTAEIPDDNFWTTAGEVVTVLTSVLTIVPGAGEIAAGVSALWTIFGPKEEKQAAEDLTAKLEIALKKSDRDKDFQTYKSLIERVLRWFKNGDFEVRVRCTN
jgi:hypothetical protein